MRSRAVAADTATDAVVILRDIVVESMYMQAPIDDLVVFAYGSWEAARAAWGELQRSRFRPSRPRRRAAA